MNYLSESNPVSNKEDYFDTIIDKVIELGQAKPSNSFFMYRDPTFSR